MRSDIKAVQLFIDNMVGIPQFSYPAHQNAPRPKGEFASVKLLTETQVGLPIHTIIEETSDWTDYLIRSVHKLRFRIGIVETDGVASAKIMSGWMTESMKELMFSTGYGFIKCNPINLEDAKLEKEWEIRQGLSLEVYVERAFKYRIDNITSMNIGGEFITEALDTLLVQIEINN